MARPPFARASSAPAGKCERVLWWALALLAPLSTLPASTAAAQVDAGAEARAAEADAKAPSAKVEPGTALKRTLDRLDQWKGEVGRLSASLATDQPSEALEAQIRSTQQQLDGKLGELDVSLARRPDSAHLRELMTAWRGRLSDLNAAGQAVDAALERAGRRLARTDQLLDAASAAVKSAPAVEDEVLRGRLNQVVSQIEALRAQHTDYQRELTRLRVAHDEQVARVENAVARIAERLQLQQGKLLERNRPPIWRAAMQPSGWSGARARSREVANLTREYAKRNRGVLAWQAAMLLLLWLALLHAQRTRVDLRVPVPQQRAADAVLRRPRATAILLALSVTPLMYRAGTEMMGLGMAFAVLAVAGFLISAVRTAPLPWSLGVPFVTLPLDATRSLLQSGTPLSRAILTFELVLLSAAAWRLSRSKQLDEATLMRPLQSTRGLLRGLSLLSLALAACDVVGFSTLSETVGSGVLKVTYLSAAYAAAYGAAIGALAVLLSSRAVLRLKLIANRPHEVMGRARLVAQLVMGSGWVLTVLGVFGARNPVWRAARWLWAEQWELGTLTLSVGGVLSFCAVLVVGFELSKGMQYLLQDDLLPALRLPRGVPFAIATLARYTLVVLGFFLALGAAGIDLTHVSVMLGALGVGIGFGLQTVVNNWVSGLILLFERPIQVGDVVEVSGVYGTVSSIGIRSTTVYTFAGAEVMVPNSELVSMHLTNWTLTDRRRRIEMPVGVAYGSDPRRVLQVLQECVSQVGDVLTNPQPAVLFTGFGNSSLDFEVRVWVSGEGDWLATKTAVLVAIHDALGNAGIEIPFPQRDLHLRSIDASVAFRGPQAAPVGSPSGSPHLPDD